MCAKPFLPIAICLICLLPAPCLGETRTWVGGAPGNERTWVTPGNWSPVGEPKPDDVLLVSGGPNPILGANHPDGYTFYVSAGSLTMNGAVLAEIGKSVNPDKQLVAMVVGSDYMGPGTAATLTLDNYAELKFPYVNYTGTWLSVAVPGWYNAPTSTATGVVVLKNGSKLVLELGGGFDVGLYGTMDLSGGSSVNAWSAGRVDGQLNLVGANTTFIANGGMTVGTQGGGDAKVTVSQGALLKAPFPNGLIMGGTQANSRGTVTIGQNGTAELGGVTLGDSGTGLLNIINGGHVLASSDIHIGAKSAGVLTIMGTGSSLSATESTVWAGEAGRGDITLLQGGKLSVNGVIVDHFKSIIGVGDGGAELFYGYQKSSSSSLNVSRGGVYLHDGGKLTSLFTPTVNPVVAVNLIGGNGASPERALVSVHGANTTWSDRWSLVRVGHGAVPGGLKIQAGGVVSTGWMEVGYGVNSDGLVTIEGNGSRVYLQGPDPQWGLQSKDVLIVGKEGLGKVEVKNGGELTVAGDARLGIEPGSHGEITVSGSNSRLEVNESLALAGGTTPVQGVPLAGTATLSVSNQGQVKIGKNMYVWSGGTVVVNSGGKITIAGEQLTLANHAKYKAGPGAKFEFLGTNVRIESENPADVDGLANTAFVFAGGPGVTDAIEICGLDKGATWSAFSNNFTLGELVIGSGVATANVALSDLVRNNGLPDAEALYIKRLVVNPGSSLNVKGLNVYVQDYINHGLVIQNPDGLQGIINHLGAIQHVGTENFSLQFSTGGAEGSFLNAAGAVDLRMQSPQHEETVHVELSLLATLIEDCSSDGRVEGIFFGDFRLWDPAGGSALSGEFTDLRLAGESGNLTGMITLNPDENGWADAFGLRSQDAMILTLTLAAPGLAGFNQPFFGEGELTLAPIPEPATLSLLALGGLALLRRCRGFKG